MNNKPLTVKILLLIFLGFIFSGCTTLSNTQRNLYEEKIQEADRAYAGGSYSRALELYNELLEEAGFKNKFVRTITLFRIASVQEASGDKEGFNETALKLDRMRKQFTLPYYYNLKIDALLSKDIDNTILDLPGKTEIPENNVIFSVYIAGRGNDNADGTINNPLKTFNEAKKRIQQKRTEIISESGALQIVFLDDYVIGEPLLLTQKDSGTPQNPLLVSGKSSEEKTVISGGKTVKEWRMLQESDTNAAIDSQYKDKIIVAEFGKNGIENIESLVFGGFSSGRGFKSHNIPELFHHEAVQSLASWPNQGYIEIEINEPFSDDRILRWADEAEAWLHGYWKYTWADSYEKIERIDKEKRVITLAPPLNGYGFRDPQARVVNAVSEIDTPGEWAIDTLRGLLFYYPDVSFDREKTILSYASGGFLIEECDNLVIENLEIKYIRGDAVQIKNSRNIMIYRSNFNSSSGNGLTITGRKNHTIYSCKFKSLGRGGIDIRTGNWKKLEDSQTIIENCEFSDLSRIDKTYTPGIRIEGMKQLIRGNKFYNIPSSAIRLETMEVLVESNEFSNCVYESGDQGAIDVWGNPLYRGNIIRWNHFKDIVNNSHDAASIRLDDAISGYTIYENVFENGSSGDFGAVQINGGKNNLVEKNMIIDSSLVFSKRTWRKKSWIKNENVKRSLNSIEWKTINLSNKYPYLSGVERKYTGENYFVDNIIINTDSKMRGSFDFSLVFNNMEKGEIKNLKLPFSGKNMTEKY